MRPYHWVLALFALVLVLNITPAQARPLPNNVIVIDPADDPPPNLLPADEVERIRRLQQEAVYNLPFSSISPDEQVVLTTSGQQLALLDIRDGTSRPIPAGSFDPYLPLPLAGFTRFTWLDATTFGSLGVKLNARADESVLVRLSLNRESLELSAEPLPIPPNTGIVSVSPDLRRLLLALLPTDEGATAQLLPPPSTPGLPDTIRPVTPELPLALRRRAEEARTRLAPTFERLSLLQDGTAAQGPDVPPKTVDLLLYTVGEPGLRYVTTIAASSARFGDTWTADGSRLAISFFGLPKTEVERPSFDGALLSSENYRDATGNLPPDLNPFLQENNTYLIDALSGTTQILRPGPEAAAPILSAHAWSPDGTTLLVRALHPARVRGRTNLIYAPQFSERSSFRFYDTQLREVGRLESDLFSAGSFANAQADFISPDEIIFRTHHGTDRHPYYYNRASGELRNLADRAGAYYNVVSAPQSRQLVFTYTSFTDPPDIYRMGWDGKNLVRLTWAGEELRQFAALRQDPVSFTLPGGVVRSGVLVQAAAAPFPPKQAPIIVWQEGGPGSAMVNRWEAQVERPFALLPGMGFALLITPVAGRAGYTPAAFNRLVDDANFGQVDIDEQAAIARELIRRGWASRDGLGITGCSYGGYFTVQSIIRHPSLYRAANPQCAMVDLTVEWVRGYPALSPYLMGLPPYSNPEEYRRDSPIYNSDRISAAVLTFHGTEDYLPSIQNENLHLQLNARTLPVRMIKFLGEGHGLASKDNQLYAAQEQVRWFRLHLR